eukprot:PITA_04922
MDASGRSGGLALGYNPRTIRIKSSWGGQGFMGVDIFSAELGLASRIVNVYGPCQLREPFWRRMLNLTLLAASHTILGGDLNFSLGYHESWGTMAQVDSITDFMRNALEQADFVDIPMQKPMRTWRNRRVGDAALARRLDRFLLKGPLIQKLHLFKQWTKTFIKLVTEYWKTHPINREASLAKGFCKNLTELKHIVINWAKEKNRKESAQLTTVEEELSSLLDERNLGFSSAVDKTRLIELENQRSTLLRQKEESLRLRSRAIWLKAGDENSRFFHNYAKGRKVANTIWNLPLPDGGLADTFNKLSRLGTSHFRSLFRNPPGTNLADIIEVASHFPRFVNEDDSTGLMEPVTMEELESTLKWFKRDKSPGPDGWTIEFYLAFFDQMGQDLISVIEECRTSGCLYHAINSTFIALIPKSDSPSSFDDFRPISLYNVLNKIISKIIANQLKPILSTHIAPQRFAFLEDRQIHEAIGSAQEALHSIWTKHHKSTLLKIDLSKAFDRVSWLYIKMILIHLGFPHPFINWIMACITTPTFSILINGSASHYFHSERGLRQGCPLSPLLFLLVMEGLSRLIISASREGSLKGLKITEECYLTHLLFVDVVLILLDGSIRDTLTFSRILKLFSQASGMQVNRAKSTISLTRTSVNEAQNALQAFLYSIHPLDRGLKYLGFWFLPKDCRLDLAGIQIRKAALMLEPSIPIQSRQTNTHQICAGGHPDWQKIALPKKWGGWGLKDLPLFAQALAAKMSWALITSQNLWTCLSYQKYIWPLGTLDWIRLPNWNRTGASSIWKAILHSMPMIRDNLAWKIRDGTQARIGIDPWAGSGGRHILPQDLVEYLLAHNINVIAQIADRESSDIFHQAWRTAHQLNLPPRWHQSWQTFKEALIESHIRIIEGQDELIWSQSDSGYYTPKARYTLLISHKKPEKQGAHRRNLLRRAYHGPTWCTICKAASESTEHLFLQCRASQELWSAIKNTIPYTGNWAGPNLTEAWTDWAAQYKGSKMTNLPVIVIWHIWKARNRIIFQDCPVFGKLMEAEIIATYGELPEPPPPHVRHPHPPPRIDHATPWAYFDGAANQQSCGGGFIIYKTEQHYYSIKVGLGAGTNNFADLITLRHLLHFSMSHHISCINIFGDSKTIINWFNNISNCHIHTLSIILNEILEFKAAFNNISCSHIYREHNESADRLSKEATMMDRGVWEITEEGHQEFKYYHRPYIDLRYQHAPEQ